VLLLIGIKLAIRRLKRGNLIEHLKIIARGWVISAVTMRA
jgi:hypothetical protein